MPATASHIQVTLRVGFVIGSGLAQDYARAEGGLQRPVADNVPVGRGQAVEVVNVELPGEVTAQEFHLLWEPQAVSSGPHRGRRGCSAAPDRKVAPPLAGPHLSCQSAPAPSLPAPAHRLGRGPRCVHPVPVTRPHPKTQSSGQHQASLGRGGTHLVALRQLHQHQRLQLMAAQNQLEEALSVG